MRPECPLPRSQDHSTCPYPKSREVQSTFHKPNSCRPVFNNILTSTPSSPFPHVSPQNPVHSSPLPLTCHMPHPSNYSCLKTNVRRNWRKHFKKHILHVYLTAQASEMIALGNEKNLCPCRHSNSVAKILYRVGYRVFQQNQNHSFSRSLTPQNAFRTNLTQIPLFSFVSRRCWNVSFICSI